MHLTIKKVKRPKQGNNERQHFICRPVQIKLNFSEERFGYISSIPISFFHFLVFDFLTIQNDIMNTPPSLLATSSYVR